MKKRGFWGLGYIVSAFFCFATAVSPAAPIAFPGAEGSGRYATGGRGGEVYEVTNLSNWGTGSIVDALSQPNRTVVFRISGTIELGDVILYPRSNTTIAGQTAPGDGICIKGRIYIGNVSNVVIRYIRVRVDEGAMNSNGDAIDIASGNNIIIDHVSGSYARDETISCQNGSDNVTVQWCIMSEALTFEQHSYGSLVRGAYGEQKTYHHNLYAHNWGRNPRPGNYTNPAYDQEGLYFDFRNNVMYNWAGNYPGYNADTAEISRYNFVGNVAVKGPESSWAYIMFQESAENCYAYWSGNAWAVINYPGGYSDWYEPSDQWDLVRFDSFAPNDVNSYIARSYEIPMEPVITTSAQQALTDVLADAGASFPARDIIDARIVNDVTNYSGHSIHDTNEQPEGAWPVLNSDPAPTDSDHDGMPNTWENANGLDAYDSDDRNYYDLHLDYTNLEVYLSSLVGGDVTAPSAPTSLAATAGDATVSLDWNDNSEGDLIGYNIFRSTTSGSGYVQLNSELLTESEYTDNDVNNTVTYYYVVNAVDSVYNRSAYSVEEPATPEDLIAPAAPAGLWASIADGNVLLEWNGNSESDFDGYNVYRSMTPGSGYAQLTLSLLSSSNYTDDTTVSGNTYYYVVTALDIWSNESDDSVEVSAMLGETGIGTILREYWTDINGASISDMTLDVDYPDYPAGSNQLSSLEGPTDWDDSYGTHIRGYVHPPATGDYTFYIASDGNSELGLSSNGSAANASIIAYVSGYTNPRQWDKYPEQQSSPISLTAGQKYYIEVLHKDDNSSDNLSVAWSGPGISQQVLAGAYLSPWFVGVYGDTTDDDWVDMNDLPDFMTMWMEADCAATSAWDLNGDCAVDFSEFSVVAYNWMADVVSPAAPGNLSAIHGDETVSLDWNDNAEDDFAGYNVYRSMSLSGDFIKLNGSLLIDSNYVDTSVTNGTTYYYVVSAVDTSLNESGSSNKVSATPEIASGIITIQEEQVGFCNVEGIVTDVYEGFTGTGYADTDEAYGKGIEWRVNVLSAGTYTFTWRYAHGNLGYRAGKLFVNGSIIYTSIQFPRTGSWTNWSTVSVNVNLTTGIKDIRLEGTTLYGLANFDYLELTGTNVEVSACP